MSLLFLSCSGGAEKNGDVINDKSIADTAAAPQPAISAARRAADEITVRCKKLDSFSFEVQERNFSEVDNLMDSVAEMNRQITSLIIHHPQEDENSFIELLKANTGIRVISSANSNLRFYTWADAPISQTRFSYATIVDYSANSKRIIAPFNNLEYSIDNVYTIKHGGRPVYLVASSATVGSAHIVNKIAVYEISGDKIAALKRVFKRNGQHQDELRFEYFLNTKIDGEPEFKVDEQEMLVNMPVITEHRDSVVGELVYALSLHK